LDKQASPDSKKHRRRALCIERHRCATFESAFSFRSSSDPSKRRSTFEFLNSIFAPNVTAIQQLSELPGPGARGRSSLPQGRAGQSIRDPRNLPAHSRALTDGLGSLICRDSWAEVWTVRGAVTKKIFAQGFEFAQRGEAICFFFSSKAQTGDLYTESAPVRSSYELRVGTSCGSQTYRR
jgi:hypothetical protein